IRRRADRGRRHAVGALGAGAARGVGAHPSGRPGAAADSDGERGERRATGNPAVRPRRPAEAVYRDPGSAIHRESPPRAPMPARVSFPDRAKRTGAAVAWIVAFGIAGGASGWAVSRFGPDPSPAWALAWTSLSGAVGFGLATLLVGRVLDRRSWAYLGWRPRAGVPAGLLGGVLLGAGMAAGAAGLAVLVGGASVTNTGDWAGWGRGAVPLGAGFLLAALTEELAFRGYPLRRLADAVGAVPATSLGAIGFGLAPPGKPS